MSIPVILLALPSREALAAESISSQVPSAAEFRARLLSGPTAETLASTWSRRLASGATTNSGANQYVMKVANGCYLYNCTNGGKNKLDERCSARNDRYAFELQKGKKSDAWLLARMDLATADLPDDKLGYGNGITGNYKDVVENSLASLTKVMLVVEKGAAKELNISDIERLPGYQLFSVDRRSSEATYHFRIAVAIRPGEAVSSDCAVTFDDSFHGLPSLVEQSFTEGKKTTQFKYSLRWEKASETDYKYTQVIDLRDVGPEAPADNAGWVIDNIGILSLGPIESSAFTLTSYGFPEPAGTVSSRSARSVYMWLLAGIAACGVSTLIVIRRRRSS
jgi:hypothetical protein